jgi:hypothetical protein
MTLSYILGPQFRTVLTVRHALFQFSLYNCVCIDFGYNLFSCCVAYNLLGVSIERLHITHKIMSNQPTSSSCSSHIGWLLLSLVWLITLMLNGLLVYGGLTQSGPAVYMWCSFIVSSRPPLSQFLPYLSIGIEIATVGLCEFLLRYNQQILDEFSKPGVSQSLQMRTTLKETTMLSHGLKYSVRVHGTLWLAILGIAYFVRPQITVCWF